MTRLVRIERQHPRPSSIGNDASAHCHCRRGFRTDGTTTDAPHSRAMPDVASVLPESTTKTCAAQPDNALETVAEIAFLVEREDDHRHRSGGRDRPHVSGARLDRHRLDRREAGQAVVQPRQFDGHGWPGKTAGEFTGGGASRRVLAFVLERL